MNKSQTENIKVADEVSAGTMICCGESSKEASLALDNIRDQVQVYYARHALSSKSCCGDSTNNLYEPVLLSELPEDISNFSLGCGDPITLAELSPGEIVLDLGSGGGLDCFLAARQVGDAGYVIGVDMTPEMLQRARSSAQRLGFANVEFKHGYLEELPLEDSRVDVIISNCVINLSPDKSKVFAEMYRVLKPGGRISVSDIIVNGELPDEIKNNMAAWGACVAGALTTADYQAGLQKTGFTDIKISAKNDAGQILDQVPAGIIFSAAITARK